ncbi:Mitochondrial thiamine pyrophosphate carrier 1 [Daldinia childiae]|uniref:Mitochondrial thiamine pyrophosphate carrier 1 n=1 Tax=Daldinia childiae TaxID=326645 RepID=UPI0014479559|nr:Mitochondrial thiamine pyrophosphate carrier 1 [Daldinia childiae]KAF3055644.1 Mitochondrial thiamine pyrophosphate carrier 1 [Daldinia childiae]
MSKSGPRLKDEGSRLQVVTAGATAGLISRFVVAPLDVVKIRLQLQSHSLSDPRTHLDLRGSPIYKGTIGTFRHIVANEGITALWKGNVPAELMYVAYASIQFTTYRSTTQLLRTFYGDVRRLPQSVESFVSGAAAGAAATAATYPLDLLRTRFAAQGNDRVYMSLRRAIADIARDEGAPGFFRGLAPALAQIVPFMGLFFAVYEGARLPLGQVDALPWGTGDATAGVIASVVAKTGVFPLDLVRKRIQVQGPTRSRYVHKNIPEYAGTVSTIRRILEREGVRGLYRGLPVSLLKAAPASAVTMWTYERTLNSLVKKAERNVEL